MRWPALVLVALVLAGCVDPPAPEAPAAPDAPAAPETDEAEPPRESAIVGARLAREILNATPGHLVTFAVQVRHDLPDPLHLDVALDADETWRGAGNVTVPPGAGATVFVSLRVPADAAPGEVALTLRLSHGRALLLEEPEAARVVVLPSERGFGREDVGHVLFTGRVTRSGEVFHTNDPSLMALDGFPRTPDYRASTPPLVVRHGHALEGFWNGLQGMLPGESRSVVLPPEEAYGAAVETRRQHRLETIERRVELPLQAVDLTRATLDEMLAQANLSSEGMGPGDTFVLPEGPNAWRYVVVAIDEAQASIRLSLQVGEAYTLHPFWPGGSVVEAADDTRVVFFTTPTTSEEEAFTVFDIWPNMSRVDRVGADTVVVRHDPPIGHEFHEVRSQWGIPALHRVVAIDEGWIVMEVESPLALAGETVTFDLLLLPREPGEDPKA